MLDLAQVSLAQAGPAVAAAFLASLVEFVEALTIVLAVGTVRGWRPALIGAGAGIAVLAALVAALGPALGLVPIAYLQVLVGTLLLLFGFSWLRKAVLRAAGIVPLRDELKAFVKESEIMATAARQSGPQWWDTIAVGSAGNLLLPASFGAAIAGLLVLLAGLALHRPLARVPENSLKWAVGILLSAWCRSPTSRSWWAPCCCCSD